MTTNHKVVLISMPWANIRQPSLALGILASICHEESLPVKTIYPNMDLSAMVGFDLAQTLATERILFGLSEHLFACDLFDTKTLRSDEYLGSFASLPPPFDKISNIKRLRDEVIPAFLNKIQKGVLQENPSVVGFTSTFNQVLPSLALARRLKMSRSDIRIVAGGACFDGEMGQEYHRVLPGILDHVFMGEAEESFREFLRRLVAGKSTHGIPGVTDFVDGSICLQPNLPLADLNQSPSPDYDDYFFEKDRVQKEYGAEFYIQYLPFESSRGCWWGQKSHCTFCGLNDGLMRFREKGVDRVVSEIVSLSSKYHVLDLAATDWIISRKSRGLIFQKLRDLDTGIECFYETRSDMSKEEIALMRDAGVKKVQPGIESFSTELLHLMKKGTSRIRQVQFVRWCKEYGVTLGYNLLCGFPGDQAEWYLNMADFLPRIIHLQPPQYNMSEIEMHRFSPIFERRNDFGINHFEIRKDYAWNFPMGFVDLKKIGYFFEYKCSAITPLKEYSTRLRDAVNNWIQAHSGKTPPIYFYTLGPGFVRVTDQRQGNGSYLDLEGLYRDIFLLADKIQTVDTLRNLLAPIYPAEIQGPAVEEAVQEMLEQDILMKEDDLILALPIGYKPRTTKELHRIVLGDLISTDKETSLPSALNT